MAQNQGRPPVGQPMPRMTDNMAHQAGPGPQSLKLAALSANSFHLDSPPFTGTAGPLGEHFIPQHPRQAFDDEGLRRGVEGEEGEDDLEGLSSTFRRRTYLQEQMNKQQGGSVSRGSSTSGRANATTSPSALRSGSRSRAARDTEQAASREDMSGAAGYPDAVEGSASSTAVPSRHSHSRTMSRGHDSAARGGGDGDVPQLDLDDAQQDASVSDAIARLHTSSLSPPPFSSASTGPMPHGNGHNGHRSHTGKASPSESSSAGGPPPLSGRALRNREVSRPVYTQISDGTSVNGNAVEDAASSSAFDGDADADAEVDDDELGGNATLGNNRDSEVDGDDRPFVIRGYSDGLSGIKKMPLQSQTKEGYRFPRYRLPTRMRNESKIPLVIVACGSFSPPTYLHLRIFEMAKDQVIEGGKYELLGGYYSPVSDYYKKEGLAKATHRVRMCELAVEKTSTWLMVDAWESLQDEYQRTAVVLDHFDEEVNGGPNGGVLLSDGSRRRVRVMLLAGGDLIQSMGEPGVWADADLNHILGKYGCMIVERTGADVWSFLLSHDLLWRYRKNLKIVKQTIFNDISSSKVRLFVRRGQSIKYLLPNSVIHYIEEHQLYRLPQEHDVEPPDADLESL